MGIGLGIFLIVVGAILAFAVGADAWEVVNLQMVGYICMGAGGLALILGLVYNAQRTNTTHREIVDRRDDPRPPAV